MSTEHIYFEVQCTKLFVVERGIEGFDIRTYIFKDETKALDFAYKTSKQEIKTYGEYELIYNEYGNYKGNIDEFEEWPGFRCTVRDINLYLDKDIILSLHHSA